jgi:hypothetical protein
MTKKCMKYNFTISWSSFNFGNKAIIIILFLKKKKKKKKKVLELNSIQQS